MHACMHAWAVERVKNMNQIWNNTSFGVLPGFGVARLLGEYDVIVDIGHCGICFRFSSLDRARGLFHLTVPMSKNKSLKLELLDFDE
jgi:hypothetical protein